MSTGKALNLYSALRSERERLVRFYESNGTIRYDQAIGLTVPGDITPTGGLSAAQVRNNTTINVFDEFGVQLTTGALGNANLVRTSPNFPVIKQAIIDSGVASGSMLDFFRKTATNKVVEVYANDAALAFGMLVFADVPCLIRIKDDINSIHARIVPGYGTSAGTSSQALPGGIAQRNTAFRGLVHSLPGKVETDYLVNRGLFKPLLYRMDADTLTNPVSIWSITDKSRLSQNQFGVNSLIRMWGKNQVIDLEGHTVDVHERPNLVAGFSVIIDLSDSHFAALTSKAAKNAHVYSSTGQGRLGRNNHFQIRGHYVDGFLMEDVHIGDKSALNKGSYFGTAIFNESQNIVFKDVKQETTIKHAPRSSLGLNWTADLIMTEILTGKFAPVATVAASHPWMKFTDKAALDPDTYGNGKTTPYPVIKSISELQSSITGGDLTEATRLRKYLVAAQEAYRASMKNHDDMHNQINVAHGKNFLPLTNGKVLIPEQMGRTTNLTVAQPLNRSKGYMVPESVSYGFRAGSTSEGVGNLSSKRDNSSQEIYLIDCVFENMTHGMMEAVNISSDKHGLFKGFNGQALRPFGYANNKNPAAGAAAASMLLSNDAVKEVFGVTNSSLLHPKSASPYQIAALDTAAIAFANTPVENGFASAASVSGLYKGNDVLENSLATITAVAHLLRFLPTNATLNGLNNSNLDIGILAWRYSMMNELNASSACHVGIKGGYLGDITDRTISAVSSNVKNDGELYPWFVGPEGTDPVRGDNTSAPTSVIDKDQDFFNATGADKNRETLTVAYLGTALPTNSNSLFKFKLSLVDPENPKSGVQLKLIKSVSGAAVTYADCATLLGFSGIGLNTRTPTDEVVYNVVNGLDGQNHVHKGTFGIRLDQTTNCGVIRCRIADIVSEGALPERNMIASNSVKDALDIRDVKRPDSHVNEIHGLSLNGVTNCYVEDMDIANSETLESIFGIEIQGQCKNVEIKEINIANLSAGKISSDNFGQNDILSTTSSKSKCIGIRVSDDSTSVKISSITVDNMYSHEKDCIKEIIQEQ